MKKISFLLALCLIFSVTPINSAVALTSAIGVTEKGYDDIGAVLTSMGSAYAYTNITNANLADPSFNLNAYDRIFINCSSSNAAYASSAKDRLRNWVSSGGALYASDWAFEYIDQAFPGYINFPTNAYIGSAQTITANVTDPGLSWYLNPASPQTTMGLKFDLGAWVVIDSVRSGSTVYLTGNVATSSGAKTNMPLVVSFKYGKGRVTYTTFHNEAQTTAEQQKLLEYLVLIPNASAISSSLLGWLQGFSPDISILAENIGTLNQGQTSMPFGTTTTSIQDLVFGLNWGGSTLGLSVYKPDGTLYQTVSSSNPPVKINVNNATTGRWTYTVNGASVPTANYPYVVIAGKNGASATSLSLSAKPKTIKKGSSTVLSGKLKDANGKVLKKRKIKLLKKVKKSWKAFATVTTNGKGKYSYRYKPAATTVIKAKFGGNSDFATKTSKAVRVKVKK